MKKLLCLILSIAAALPLAACASGGAASSAAAPAADSANADVKKYAVILKTKNTDFWSKMYTGIEAEGKAKGWQVDLYTAKSDDDTEGQLAILESCLTKDYAGIAIAPCSAVNMITGVKEANGKGITIVNIDEEFDPKQMESQGATCSAYIATDNKAVGKKGAEFLCSQIDPNSQVGVIEGKSGNVSSEDRAGGAKEAFKAKGMKIVGDQCADWDMQKALDTAATWIQQYPDIKAIYCCNDTMAMGAMQAIINANKVGKIKICGTDGDTDAIKSVSENKLTATIAQDSAAIGSISLDKLVDAVENPSKYKASCEPEKTPINSVLITAENAAQYLK
ncbi:sugar-binding protein [Clostridium sp. W14A]|nr:sugar-binding protein [Clostridium sp. W14A]